MTDEDFVALLIVLWAPIFLVLCGLGSELSRIRKALERQARGPK